MLHKTMKHKVVHQTKKLFPAGIAVGDAFCNREQERKILNQNITHTEHTVLLAPRRYGKTSLATKVMDEIRIHHAWVELFSATSFESAERKIALAVGELLYMLAPNLKKMELNLKHFFKKMNPEIILSSFSQKVVLYPLENPIESITEVLIQLDRYACKLHKHAVIVLDEFQQIAEIKNGYAIEACIRQAVERSQAITYIFSGSNRRMLADMFGQSSRPLYKLCKLLSLDRITFESYEVFIQKAAQQKWRTRLDGDVFKEIMIATERHPYYVNALCSQLWKLEQLPTFEDVRTQWDEFTFNHKTIIIGEILDLSINQKKCLNALAKRPTQEPLGKDFQQATMLPLSSLKQVINVLLKRDIIYKDENGYLRILDPALSYLLRRE
jgi:uncharacterized protein